jgi:integrase
MVLMNLARALESWRLDLRVQRKSPRTIETYSLAVTQLDEFCDGIELTEITTHDIRLFLDHMLTTRSDSTARQRYGSLSVFFGWLMAEELIVLNPMDRVKAPKVEDKPIVLVDERIFRRYLDSCDRSFKGRRDTAILWLFWDCGIRLGEIAGISVADIDRQTERVYVEGKSGFRRVPFTPETARAINRYLLVRDDHKFARFDGLWLGERGVLSDRGISQMLTKRAIAHDLPHVNPHRFRHSFTDRLLSEGVNEGDTMRLMGWSRGSRSMLDRYGAIRREDRAFEAYRRHIG